jgi:two-component system, cell cycle sensor histidine kinase and response regulator CckA
MENSDSMMAIMAKSTDRRPHSGWKRRLPVFIAGSLGIGLTVAGFFAVQEHFLNKAREDFGKRVTDYAQIVSQAIERNLEVVQSIGGLYAASQTVEEHVFRAFVRPGIDRHPGIQALAWVPRVAAADRRVFEAAVTKDGHPGFRISERNDAGQLVSAARRNTFLPIRFLDPHAGNEGFFGLDLASLAEVRAALEQARDDGRLVATGRLPLQGWGDGTYRVLAVLPVFRNGFPHQTARQRRENLIGYAVGVFRTGEMIEAVQREHRKPAGLDIYLLDESAERTERLLYYHPSRARPQPPTPASATEVRSGLYFAMTRDVAGRQWSLIFKPVSEQLGNEEKLVPLVAAAMMALLTTLLVQHLFAVLNRTRIIEEQVADRTAALAATNLALETENAERRRTEEALHESEERYRNLIEVAPFAILVQSRGTVAFANPATAELLGAPNPEEVVGKDIGQFIQGEGMPAVDKTAGSTAEGLAITDFVEREILRFDGEPVSVEAVSVPIVFLGEAAVLTILRDVTEHKRAEAQLIQAAKLATLGEMAAGITHELSQPLNIIRMTADGCLLRIGRGRASPEYQKKQFEILSDQARRMAEIIDYMHVFSRKDSGGMEPIDPVAVVRSTITLLDKPFRVDGIVLSTTLPRQCALVVGRAVQLEQVILNLLTNAHDSILDKRREMEKKTDWRGLVQVEVICNEDAGAVEIIVTDNGTGIPEDKLGQIFDPFFTSKEAGRGTGIGLSISSGIVSTMGGKIRAFNAEDGMRFEIHLPAATGDVRSAEPVPERRDAEGTLSGDSSQQRHVLVVDDEPRAVEVMGDFLEELGYRVSTAGGGVEAYERFVVDPAEIVITDLRMPLGDGLQLMRRLAERAPRLPIIVVTGHMGRKGTPEQEFRRYAAEVLSKPVSLLALAEVMDRLMRETA